MKRGMTTSIGILGFIILGTLAQFNLLDLKFTIYTSIIWLGISIYLFVNGKEEVSK